MGSSSLSKFGDDPIVRAGGVVFVVFSAVFLVESVGGDCVPETITVSASDVASCKVGFVGGFLEVEDYEVGVGVVVFEVEALQIAVVPGDVGEGDSGHSCFFVGGVPVLVAEFVGLEASANCEEGAKQYQYLVVHFSCLSCLDG